MFILKFFFMVPFGPSSISPCGEFCATDRAAVFLQQH